MDATVAKTGTEGNIWGGGQRPMRVPYGKLMMWFFLASDAITFASFLASYGYLKFKFLDIWPRSEDVFTEIPFMHGVEAPLIYTALMTFVLIVSSVTMVLAVDAGHHMNKKKVTIYLALTILGGLTFLGSQAYEWTGFIVGNNGAIETHSGRIYQVFTKEGERVALRDMAANLPTKRETLHETDGTWFMESSTLPPMTLEDVQAGFKADTDLVLRSPVTGDNEKKIMLSRDESLNVMNSMAKDVVIGANLHHNEYGLRQYGDFFFWITGFHGFHVTMGVIILIIIFTNVVLGTYEKRGSYLMVEKVGLYWHFVDLVWVFVFTFFYLV